MSQFSPSPGPVPAVSADTLPAGRAVLADMRPAVEDMVVDGPEWTRITTRQRVTRKEVPADEEAPKNTEVPGENSEKPRKRWRSKRSNKSSRINGTMSFNFETGVFNLQGGRKKSKWTNLIEEAFSINKEGSKEKGKGGLLVGETWLMNEEIPPKLPQYEWIGSNREGKTGKYAKAGVGILIPEKLGQIISTRKGRDSVVAKMKIQSTEWVCFSICSPRKGAGKCEIVRRNN